MTLHQQSQNNWIKDTENYFVIVSWYNYDFQDIIEEFACYEEALNFYSTMVEYYKNGANASDHDATISLYQGKSHIKNKPQYMGFDKLLRIETGDKN